MAAAAAAAALVPLKKPSKPFDSEIKTCASSAKEMKFVRNRWFELSHPLRLHKEAQSSGIEQKVEPQSIGRRPIHVLVGQ